VLFRSNGDLASEVAIDALEKAVARHPKWDHRHIIHHFQMADEVQIQRLRNLGGGANLFANHLYYFGDQHHAITLGPARAARINPCGSALRYGLPIAIHSDTPVTPLSPLFTAACAVNRTTESDRVLGGDERITVANALRAITLGAAWTLKMENVIGSITPGKFADFAALADDPFSVEASKLGAIEVVGTISGGRNFVA
jgi:predicted amidohydrolase YtcJ